MGRVDNISGIVSTPLGNIRADSIKLNEDDGIRVNFADSGGITIDEWTHIIALKMDRATLHLCKMIRAQQFWRTVFHSPHTVLLPDIFATFAPCRHTLRVNGFYTC